MVLLTAMLTGCSDNIPDNMTSPTEANEAEEGYYTASFNVSIPSFEQQVTRSTLFTNEGIGKNCVKLFCFDEEGQFVGFGKSGNSVKSKVSEEKQTATSYKTATKISTIMDKPPLEISLPRFPTRRHASIWWQIQKASTRPSTGITSQNGWVCTRIY